MHYISGSVSNIVADDKKWAETSGGGGAGGQYAVDAQSSGSVTATLTWVPAGQADPAPKSVIVAQTASALAAGGNNAGGAYQADDGLGDPQGGSGYAYSSGTHYSVQDGTSGTITLPAVSMSAKTPPYTLPITGGCAGASASYSVQAYPATITLRGTTRDSNGASNIMVGQTCAAIFTIEGSPSGMVWDRPNWIIPGSVYKRFDISSDQKTGTAVPYPDPHGYPEYVPTFYWKEDNADDVSKTVKATAYVHYTDASGTEKFVGEVTAEKSVKVWEPGVWSDTSSLSSESNPALGIVGLSDVGIISNSHDSTSGFFFGATVGTPPLFVDGNGVNYGRFAWLQLCKLNVNGGVGTQMSEYQLDSAFPYKTGAGDADAPGDTYSADATDGRHVFSFFTDSPEEDWSGGDTSLSINNSFQLFLMYLPPYKGEGVNWVPLSSYQWNFSASATRATILSSWTLDAASAVTYQGSQPNPPYPQWNDRKLSASH